MAKKKKPQATDLSSNHPIREIWSRRDLRKDVLGLMRLAEQGDVTSVRDLLARFLVWVSRGEIMVKPVRSSDLYCRNCRRLVLPATLLTERDRIHRGELVALLSWITSGFRRALKEKKSLDVVSGFKPNRSRGRPRLSTDELERSLDIAYFVACEVDKKISIKSASTKAAKKFYCSQQKAERAYRSLML